MSTALEGDIAGLPLAAHASFAERLGARLLRSAAGMVPYLLVIGLLEVLSSVLGQRWLGLAVFVGALAIAVVGLEVTTGYAGQISLGQNGFVGIGAYATGILTTREHMPFLASVVIGVLASAIVAAALAVIMGRLRGIYLAMATLAFGLVVVGIATGATAVTDGPTGIFSIKPPSAFGFAATTETKQYWLGWGVALAAAAAVSRLGKSRAGLAWMVIAEQQDVAMTCGVNIGRRKLQALVLGAALAAAAGSLYASFISTITPDAFSETLLISLLAMSVMGGARYKLGPVLGSILAWLLVMYAGTTSSGSDLVFGSVFVLFVAAAPSGLLGAADSLLKTFSFRRSLLPRAGGPHDHRSFGRHPLWLLLTGLGQTRQPVATTYNEKRTSLDASPALVSTAILDHIEAAAQPSGAGIAPGPLRVSNLVKAFGGIRAVNDVSMELSGSRIYGIVGPNGAGKSTLLQIISGLETADKGEVIWNGTDITKWPAWQRSSMGMGRTFQTPAVVPGLSVVENVMIGGYRRGSRSSSRAPTGMAPPRYGMDSLRDEANAMLDACGLKAESDKSPAGLPFGALRLVEFARALMSQPSMLLLDEALSGLSRSEKREIMQLVGAISQTGMSVVLVEHDTEVVRELCDEVFVLDAGSLLAHGPAREVFELSEVISAYLGATVR